MDPLTAAIGVITLALKFANSDQAKQLVSEGKNLITSLMDHGLISKEQQDTAHAHIDEVCAAFLAGNEPPAWDVEADPS